jgi:hypothetical protein
MSDAQLAALEDRMNTVPNDPRLSPAPRDVLTIVRQLRRARAAIDHAATLCADAAAPRAPAPNDLVARRAREPGRHVARRLARTLGEVRRALRALVPAPTYNAGREARP